MYNRLCWIGVETSKILKNKSVNCIDSEKLTDGLIPDDDITNWAWGTCF